MLTQYGVQYAGFTHIRAANNGYCAKLVGASGISVNSAIDAINAINITIVVVV
jgi:hypothetical protein